MTNYVIGVDGGGTKTHCALFNTEGTMIDMIEWGPTNHESLIGGFIDLKVELNHMLSHILGKNNLSSSDIGHYMMGLAGVDTLAQHCTITQILKDLGCTNLTLSNDAYLGVKAGCPSGVGICAINGTGCTVAGIDEDGQMLQIGGQGDLTGDTGGGGYLGMLVIRTVYHALFKEDTPTLLTDRIFELLGITSKTDYIETVTSKLEQRELNISSLCKLIFEAANLGDTASIQILKNMGIENAKSINGAIKNLNFINANTIEVVLAGSVYVKGQNPTAIDTLKELVLSLNPGKEIVFRILQEPPVMGAVIWALEQCTGTTKHYNKILSEFQAYKTTTL
jgi:N-acetylglucosamine kinase-like BadF-type ATPase